jgi:hypothetical protein
MVHLWVFEVLLKHFAVDLTGDNGLRVFRSTGGGFGAF